MKILTLLSSEKACQNFLEPSGGKTACIAPDADQG
jgi:hypothetical protein